MIIVLEKYKRFYQYTDTSPEIEQVADELFDDLDIQNQAVEAATIVSRYVSSRIWDRSTKPPTPINKGRTLLESRFAKSSDLIKKPMASCGAVSNLVASLLRQAGFAVRLVHGDLPKSDQHSWNEIWLENNQTWHAFDAASGKGEDFHLSPEHKRILDCVDWSEIAGLLRKDHEKNLRRHLNDEDSI